MSAAATAEASSLRLTSGDTVQQADAWCDSESESEGGCDSPSSHMPSEGSNSSPSGDDEGCDTSPPSFSSCTSRDCEEEEEGEECDEGGHNDA